MAVLVGLLLAFPARPAAASEAQLTLSVTQRWQLASTQGTWTPYVVNVHDDGPGNFTGDVLLVANDTRTGGPPNTYPVYRASITVTRGSDRSVTFYVIDAPNGYEAELRDTSGRVVLHSGLVPRGRAGSALGVLSDLPQAEQKIDAPLRSLTRVDASLARFPSPAAFPSNAVYLSGLSGVILDQFSSTALSQTQVQALKDFVGLGGTLIEAGGVSWRPTLLPLPPELLPMRPTSTATASLAPLGDLAGLPTDATAQVATGDTAGAKVALASPEGLPLVVESAYGAGRIVELAFDPFGEPFDSRTQLAAMAWAQAIARAQSGVQGGSRAVVANGFGPSANLPNGAGSGGPGSWAPGFGSGMDPLSTMLQDSPAAASPPVGTLGGLLVAYVLLVGLLNYLFMKALGQRVLLWISVPAVAVAFTAGAYLVGFGSRGSDFYVTEVQVQRLAPEGAVQSYTFDGVYAPRRGDVSVSLPSNTLASTVVASGGLGDSRGDAVISTGSRPQVTLGNVAVWSMRTVQTLAVAHPYAYDPKASMPVSARLHVQKGRVVGTIANLSPHTVRDLELVGPTGSEIPLATTLGPAATAQVDVELAPGSSAATAGSDLVGKPIAGISETARAGLVRLAASQALSGRPGELALIGFTDATDSLRIEGARPGRQAVAALVEPFEVQAADSLAGIAPRQRLVASYAGDGDGLVDVYDFDLPQGLTARPALNYTLLETGSATVRSIEVYDWDSHTWRPLPKQQVPVKTQAPTPLAPGEASQGTVRVRVREAMLHQATISVGDQQP